MPDRGLLSGAAARLGLLVLAGATAVSASAQTSVPGVPRDRPDQRPATAPSRQAPIPALPRERDANAPIAPFTLSVVDVEGSSLPGDLLAAATRRFVGRTIDNAALSEIVAALARVYAGEDIALYTVLVPEQRFTGGRLRILAVEGYVGGVEVRGKLRKVRAGLLRDYLRRLERERPLKRSTLERMISLIRDMPGFQPELNFERGDRQGAVRLLIDAREQPVQLALGINNRGTALLGRTQAQADLYWNGVLNGGDQLRGTLVLPTKVDRFQYYAAAYSTPLDADGTSLSLNASRLRTRPAAFPLRGRSTSYGVQVGRSLVRGYTRNLTATFGLDGIASDNVLRTKAGDFTLSNDRVRAVRGAMAFGATSARNEVSASATLSAGLDIFGARVDPGASKQRFRKLNIRAGDALRIGKATILRVSGAAQLTPDNLPPSEQFALGGDEYGRAYEAAIIAGDSGFAGSVEAAWRPPLGKTLAGSELYAFADGGEVRYRSRFGFPASESHLKSIGGGARARILDRVVLQLEAATGLDNPVFYADRKRTRLMFSARTLL